MGGGHAVGKILEAELPDIVQNIYKKVFYSCFVYFLLWKSHLH